MTNLGALVLAAVLEMGGDAAIRQGLLRSTWTWIVLGGTILVAYGVVVNLDRSLDFGRLMGLYIAVLFVVSQVISVVVFDERPSASLTLGGALIVAGGFVIHFGAR